MTHQLRYLSLATILLISCFSSDASAKYNPEVGRWMQRDPIGFVDGMSLNQYVRSSPMRLRDPMGLFSLQFDDNVSESDRRRIGAAVDSACDKVRDANDHLDGVSECAADKLGPEFDDAKRKLQNLEKMCDSDQVLEISTEELGQDTIATTWKDGRRISFNNDIDGSYDFFSVTGDEGWDPGPSNQPDLPPGSPGNQWHDYDPPAPATTFTPTEIVLHELIHVTEFHESGPNRDETGRHDDPYNLQKLAGNSFENSPLGKSVQAAEACCQGND